MDWSAIASVAATWLAQELRAYKHIPNLLISVIVFGVTFGFYALGHHYTEANAEQWFQLGIMWSCAALGIGRLVADGKLASASNTKEKGDPMFLKAPPSLLMLGLLAMLAMPSLARADEPLLSMKRASVAVVAKRQFNDVVPGGFAKPDDKVGPVVSYNVVPRLSLGVNALRSLTTGRNEYAVLVTIRVWSGS